MYLVKSRNFEGPLGLLLDLVEKRKMPISDVSLAEISGQYLQYVKQLEQFSAREVCSFIETASILLLIKSRSLMPSMPLTEEEERNIGDLEKRLQVYEFIRGLAPVIRENFGKNPLFARESFAGLDFKQAGSGFKQSGLFAGKLSPEDIARAIAGVIGSLPQPEKLPEARVAVIIKLEEKIMELVDRLNENASIRFAEFSNSRTGQTAEDARAAKTERIVSFLAMLELVKQGLVAAHQSDLFDNIEINRIKI